MSQDNRGLSQGSSEQLIRRLPGRTAPLVGGCMTIMAGALALINGLRGIFGESSIALGPDVVFSRADVCGITALIFGIVAIAGGINALKGRPLSLSLAGAFLGMMGGGLIGFWLGLGAVILFALSNEDL